MHPEYPAKQVCAGADWRQPDFAFTMSGYVGEIGAPFAKGKSKAANLPKWCEGQFTPIIGVVCDPLAQIPVP